LFEQGQQRGGDYGGVDVRDLGDVVEKFTGAPGCRGNLPQWSVKVGVGAHSTPAVLRGGRLGKKLLESEQKGPPSGRVGVPCWPHRRTVHGIHR